MKEDLMGKGNGMEIDVVELTSELIAMPSETPTSNRAISDFLRGVLEAGSFDVEELTYVDQFDVEKVSLVAKKGAGAGGLGLFSHSDTVPGDAGWDPFTPVLEDGRLVGRGSADMKGPLAASIAAACRFNAADLERPLVIAVTADEERGHTGAHDIVIRSQTLTGGWPQYCIVCEPSQLQPVYAHKGGAGIIVTAHGVAAHTSTDKGVSANFLIAPFLAEMAELAQTFRTEERFQNPLFDPPTNGFNLVLDDGGTASNVTAARTVATLKLRAMPDACFEEAVQMVVERAEAHGLDVSHSSGGPFFADADGPLAHAACRATGAPRAVTVPYGTEAECYQRYMDALVLGPGNIDQAHTVGEWIAVEQLHEAVEVYTRLIGELCA
ncbi:MAG: M20 family metallopeptidase [Caldilineaceae bacterium SB0670_bin_27]|uniref:M20 family metallopeptidase n=1 Tax=Caldilineaceae bacterium SB0664_bin_27 TaxID=2605260 RepID=A0A6B0YXF0_9CHLR|nr:M20 family metallopeptidase [Caldilineaceae bacterium SB0664_bin_27]MYJ78988.1 M20 family metallopeptidase [Caldilineaceae bacterium SB0670_bin_27]